MHNSTTGEQPPRGCTGKVVDQANGQPRDVELCLRDASTYQTSFVKVPLAIRKMSQTLAPASDRHRRDYCCVNDASDGLLHLSVLPVHSMMHKRRYIKHIP